MPCDKISTCEFYNHSTNLCEVYPLSHCPDNYFISTFRYYDLLITTTKIKEVHNVLQEETQKSQQLTLF